MKVIVDNQVFDLQYGKYDVVATLTPEVAQNEVGKPTELRVDVRRDKTTNGFYLFKQAVNSHWEDPSRVCIQPLVETEAAALAAEVLDYDHYVEFFHDPEGADASLRRAAEDAKEKLNAATESKDYWYGEYLKLKNELNELKKKLEADKSPAV